MKRLAGFAILAACLGACGGGGGSGGGTCGKVPACGGNLVGTWNAIDACESPDTSTDSSGCTETLSVTVPDISTIVTFAANLTYTTTVVSVTADISADYSAACLTESGTKFTCAEVGTSLTQGGIESAKCFSAAGGGCSCTGMSTDVASSGSLSTDSGTYTVDAVTNGVELDSANGDTTNYTYCVSGSELHIIQSGTQADGTTIDADLVLQKQ